jgi:Zinc knuckle
MSFSKPINQFDGNKELTPNFVKEMHTVFRYDNTLNIAYGRFQDDLLPRPIRAAETDGEFFLLCQDYRDAKHKWEKVDQKANEQASISISRLHERLSVNVLSALSDVIHQDVDLGGHIIPNQQKLYAQWRAFKDKYMPKIEDYSQLGFKKMEAGTDRMGLRPLVTIYDSQIESMKEIIAMLPPPDQHFHQTLVNGLPVYLPIPMAEVQNPWLPTDAQLKSMFLNGVLNIDLQSLKLTLMMDPLKTFEHCKRELLNADDRLTTERRLRKFTHPVDVAIHPYSQQLVNISQAEKLKQQRLAIFQTDFDDTIDQKAYYSAGNNFQDQRSPPRTNSNDYRREDNRRNDNRVTNSGQFGNPNCYNCGKSGHESRNCPSTTCNSCNQSWPNVNSPGRHTSSTCPMAVSRARPRSNSRDRNQRDRSRDRTPDYNNFNSRDRSNSPGRNQSANVSSSANRSSTPGPRPDTPGRSDDDPSTY